MPAAIERLRPAVRTLPSDLAGLSEAESDWLDPALGEKR
jgi:hypothetical protein